MEDEFTEYLVSASKNLLLKHGQTAAQNVVKDLQDLVMVRLHAQYLSNLRDLQYCVSLKICDLSGNFLTNIDSLESCTNLIKLDLHNNQIEELPGPMFWGNMASLSLLYLHDNGISALDNVHSLSFCPNLIALTLLNTPLSLKIAYRHIVVNSISSLKALDYYVISDEEIVEDWRLSEKFRPFTPMLFVDYSPHPTKERRFQEEIKVVREIISKINLVLSHYSPVLIIQKWIRGYLIRKILCLIPVREVLKHKRYVAERAKQIYRGRTGSAYERRSSKHPTMQPEQHNEDKTVTPAIELIAMRDLEELHLYLRRLKLPLLSAVLRLEEKSMVKQKESKKSPRKDLLNLKKTEIQEEDEMASKFRLSGCQMPFYSVTDELQKYAEKERHFFDYVHDELRNIVHPVPPTMPVHAPVCIEKRIFARAFGTIRLRPLHAIDKAYWASQKCDIQLKKERQIMRMLIAHAAADDYICRLRRGNTETRRKRYDEDKLMFSDMLRDNLRKREMATVNNKKKFVQFLENKESKATEKTYVQVFNSQHTSLARGLLQLDGWRKREESINKKKTIITQSLEEQKHRKEVFKHFHDQRLKLLQKQNASEKSYRKFMTDEMAKERFQQSKARAKAVKTPRMKILCPLPVIGSSGLAKPLIEYCR